MPPTSIPPGAVNSTSVTTASVTLVHPVKPQSAAPSEAVIPQKADEVRLWPGQKQGSDQKYYSEAPSNVATLEASSIKPGAGVDLTEKFGELLVLAKEQGHMTYDDINDALRDNIVTTEDLDLVRTKLPLAKSTEIGRFILTGFESIAAAEAEPQLQPA